MPRHNQGQFIYWLTGTALGRIVWGSTATSLFVIAGITGDKAYRENQAADRKRDLVAKRAIQLGASSFEFGESPTKLLFVSEIGSLLHSSGRIDDPDYGEMVVTRYENALYFKNFMHRQTVRLTGSALKEYDRLGGIKKLGYPNFPSPVVTISKTQHVLICFQHGAILWTPDVEKISHPGQEPSNLGGHACLGLDMVSVPPSN